MGNELWEEDSLFLDSDENVEEKEKEEGENSECLNNGISGILEKKVVDARLEKNTESLILPPLDVAVCETVVVALRPFQNQEQNKSLEEDCLDLALDENDEEKEKQEAKNGDCDIDVSKEKKNENFTPPTQYVPVCDSLVVALIPMQDQEQNVLWEEDSLDLDLDENNEEKEKEEVKKVFQSES